jgi:uroporphyrinogen-III synthase
VEGTLGLLPLTGYTVAVTAARRREELVSLLERRGARVVSAPAIRILPLADDTELMRATQACLAEPLDVAIATTGIGFRGWLEAAEGWGLGSQLRLRLAEATLLARGPKARGAIRAAGLVDAWSPAGESTAEVLDHLLGGRMFGRAGLEGRRIAVQLHGEPLLDVVEALAAAGAEVVQVPVYRWEPPADLAPVHRLVDLVLTGQVDAVTFTSAPAAASLLKVAGDRGQRDGVVAALRNGVLACCVGPVTAAPLHRHDIPTRQPERFRLGALVREVVSALPEHRARRLTVAGACIELRGHVAIVDGDVRPIPPVPMAVLRALSAQPGRVLSRAELLPALPGTGADEHAVEMAVARLRTCLGDGRFVQTVVKRGYRLAFDPADAGDRGALGDVAATSGPAAVGPDTARDTALGQHCQDRSFRA